MLIIFDKITDLLFPPRCAICDDIIPVHSEYLCKECADKVLYINEPFCLKCGKALYDDSEYCTDCRQRIHYFKQGMAVFDYASISDSLYRFKNKGRCEYARFYATEIMRKRGDFIRSINPQCIIPVPIHKSRLKKRGYNQAEEIALEISKISKIPVISDLVCRSKKTNPLRKLNINERHKNLHNAFEINRKTKGLRRVLIIDDIYTTGSTIDAMTKVLNREGINEVFFITVTIGRGI